MDGVYQIKEGPMTHLVAAKCRGVKYRDAVALGKPILKPDWIQHLWAHKDDPTFDVSGSLVFGLWLLLIYFNLHNDVVCIVYLIV